MKSNKNIRKIVRASLALFIFASPIASAMDSDKLEKQDPFQGQLRDQDYYEKELQKLKELNVWIHSEVDRISADFKRNREEYQRTRGAVRTSEITTIITMPGTTILEGVGQQAEQGTEQKDSAEKVVAEKDTGKDVMTDMITIFQALPNSLESTSAANEAMTKILKRPLLDDLKALKEEADLETIYEKYLEFRNDVYQEKGSLELEKENNLLYQKNTLERISKEKDQKNKFDQEFKNFEKTIASAASSFSSSFAADNPEISDLSSLKKLFTTNLMTYLRESYGLDEKSKSGLYEDYLSRFCTALKVEKLKVSPNKDIQESENFGIFYYKIKLLKNSLMDSQSMKELENNLEIHNQQIIILDQKLQELENSTRLLKDLDAIFDGL